VQELKLMTENIGNSLQDEDGLFGDFWTNTVAGKDRQLYEHAGLV
jgi:hypothetical protein